MLVGLLAAALAAAGFSNPDALASSKPAQTVTAYAPCVGTASRNPVDHVVWVWMENEGYTSILGTADAPYESALAKACGLATNYQAISHPSLPNYLAATGGSTFGITDDGEPATHRVSAPSLFSQVDAAGESWRAYDESMPYNCDPVTAGEYAARHNPAVYYRTVHAACERQDVPLGSITRGAFAKAASAGTLPDFAFVTPNICDDAHSCPVSQGDAWLSRFLPVLFASPQYQAGRVVLFLTYDEGSGSNRVLTVVAARSVRAGTRSAVAFSHYSLLHSTELLLGLSPLGAAAAGHFDARTLRPLVPARSLAQHGF